MSEKTFEFNGRTWVMPEIDPVAYQIGIAAIAEEIIEQRKKRLVENASAPCFQDTPASEVAA